VHPSKRKGRGFEREVVNVLQAHAISAERVPLSGAVGGRFAGDISCPVRGVDQTLECKRRRSLSGLYKALGDHYAAVLRADGQEALVVLRLEDFAQLARLPAIEVREEPDNSAPQ
jgi:hypothetical protein